MRRCCQSRASHLRVKFKLRRAKALNGANTCLGKFRKFSFFSSRQRTYQLKQSAFCSLKGSWQTQGPLEKHCFFPEIIKKKQIKTQESLVILNPPSFISFNPFIFCYSSLYPHHIKLPIHFSNVIFSAICLSITN